MTAWPLSRVSALMKALLVAFGLFAVVVLSEPDLAGGVRLTLQTLLAIIWCIYVAQLLATILAPPANDYRGAILVVDVLAVLVPLAAFLVASSTGADLRDASLACGIWILKPLRDSTAFRLVVRVLANEARNLIGVMSIFGIVLFVAALVAYAVERDVQPNTFGSIPKTMWWAVVTLVDDRLWRRHSTKFRGPGSRRARDDERHRRVCALGGHSCHRLRRGGPPPGLREQMAIGIGCSAVSSNSARPNSAG